MDALEFAKQIKRMCDSFENCGDCDLRDLPCRLWHKKYQFEDGKAMVRAVEKWARLHPEKTRQSEFLKAFPQAPLKRSCLQIKPCEIDPVYTFDLLKDSNVNCLKQTCDYCRAKYWLAPLEDEG